MATYTVQANDTLESIATKFNTTVDELVKLNGLIKAGQVLKIPVPVVTPPPVTVSIKLSEAGPYGKADTNKVIQSALNQAFPGVVIDGVYGPQTAAAYMKWQQSLGFTGSDADGVPGVTSLTALGKKYGFTVVNDGSPSTGQVPTTEPAANYTKTTYGGKTVNQRTKDMLVQAATLYGSNFGLTQGSYNAGGVAASAGTHDGGGVVDVSVYDDKMLKALRQVGFAAWHRTPAEGFAHHIHAVAIGDKEMAPSAKDQVTSYFNGRNGLANNGPDTAPASIGRPYPAWAIKYGAPVK